jgi:ribokinase
MSVVVFGSINMDLVVRTPRLPSAGETLTGHTFFTAPGGKGANQAVASSRLGVATCMVGQVGDDIFGGTLMDGLGAAGVDVSGVITHRSESSGVALITVDDAGENTIVVVPGANGTVSNNDVERLQPLLSEANVLLLQLEIPLDAVISAARAAQQRGVMVVLDPAPACLLPDELYHTIDVLTPNETEAAALVGFAVATEQGVRDAAKVLIERGCRHVIIKLGGKGAYWATAEDDQFYPAFPVKAVDTVAAGDAFNGALAAALAEGCSMPEAIKWGMAAGALSTTRSGAQPSMPERGEVEALLASGHDNLGS